MIKNFTQLVNDVIEENITSGVAFGTPDVIGGVPDQFSRDTYAKGYSVKPFGMGKVIKRKFPENIIIGQKGKKKSKKNKKRKSP
jgi:hypothetical protein